MKQIFMILAALLVMSCSRDEIQAQTTNYETMTTKMYITIDNKDVHHYRWKD